MAPVARPAIRRSNRLDMAWSARLSVELWKNLLYDLLAVDDLDQETLAVDVAVLVKGDVHEDTGLLSGLDGQAMQRVRERLGVDLAHLVGGRLDHVDGEVALDAVMIRDVVVLLHELVAELLDQLDRRIGGQTDMAASAVGGVARKLDHLLADQRGLADQRRRDALALDLLEDARTLLLVEIDEHGIGRGRLDLGNVGGEI